MKEKVKRIVSLALAFLMSIGCIHSYPIVSALENDYEVYPNPHMMDYQDGSFDMTSTVNVVYEDGIDKYTKDRMNEVLAIKNIKASTSEEVKEDQTNILVGIKDSNQYVDQYVGEHYSVKTTQLFDQLDSYLLKVDNGTITVLGKDTDAAFYGLTSLYHIFKQLDGTNIRNFTMEDYANVASRGFIEGYYGNPWSTTDRMKLMEWGGYYKLNSYFYAPKDDPKHNSKWRELYTDEEIETKIKPLAEAGNKSKCRFVFALHPYMYNAIRYNSEENYQADLKVLQAKFEQVIKAGVRQIAILADDAGNVGGANYTKTLTDFERIGDHGLNIAQSFYKIRKAVAAMKLIKPDMKITKEHGIFFEKNGVLMMATLHPAALLRNPSNKPAAFEDFLKLRAKIDELNQEA